MKWHLTEDEIAKTQKGDENEFRHFFDERGYCPLKLDDGSIGKAPDYSLTNNGQRVVAEIKSRFGDQEYEKIYSEIVRRINELPFGYEYYFTHLYDKMPSNDEFDTLIAQVSERFRALTNKIELPWDLSQGLWEYEETLTDLGRAEPMSEIEKTFITLSGKTANGKMHCDTLSRSHQGYPGLGDKRYFEKRFRESKKQLKEYIEYNEIVGIIFFNHSDVTWRLFDVMALFGDLDIQFNHGSQVDTWLIKSGKNKIIGIEKKTWLSYFGFCGCNEDGSFLTIYRNGFAKHEVPKVYFPEPECKTYTIGPFDENGRFITDIPFLQ